VNVDVVVVSFNSAQHLRACVAPLAGAEGITVTVVDNASRDASLETISDLPLATVALPENRGFAAACNVGWRTGTSPFVLFLNPDATIEQDSVRRLVAVLQRDDRVAAAGPKLVKPDRSLHFSQRRFPSLRSAFAQAVLLHRYLLGSDWACDVILDSERYDGAAAPDWLEGACLLVRRHLLERLGGFDERFFLYGEDVDLAARLRALSHELRYEPGAVCVHAGEGSGPRSLPALTESRLRYAQKHFGHRRELAFRAAWALEDVLRIVLRGRHGRGAHARSLRVVLSGSTAGG
jgi:N-acetylglucosaminyl-diphospho-decaprenol L-rhamnosyltransferase